MLDLRAALLALGAPGGVASDAERVLNHRDFAIALHRRHRRWRLCGVLHAIAHRAQSRTRIAAVGPRLHAPYPHAELLLVQQPSQVSIGASIEFAVD